MLKIGTLQFVCGEVDEFFEKRCVGDVMLDEEMKTFHRCRDSTEFFLVDRLIEGSFNIKLTTSL